MNSNIAAEHYLYFDIIYKEDYNNVRPFLEEKIKEYTKSLSFCRQLKITGENGYESIIYYADTFDEIKITNVLDHLKNKLSKLKELENNGPL